MSFQQEEEDKNLTKINQDLQEQLDKAQQEYDEAEDEINTCNLDNEGFYETQLKEENNLCTFQMELDGSKEKLQLLEVCMEQVKKSKNDLERDVGFGKKDLAERKDKEKELETLIKDEDKKIVSKKTELNSFETEINSCQQQLDEKDIEIKNRRTTLHDTRQSASRIPRIENSEREIEQNYQEQLSIEREIEKLEEYRQKIHDRMKKAIQKKQSAATELEEQKNINEQHLNSLQVMKQQIKKQEESVTNLDQQLASAKEELKRHLDNQKILCENISVNGKQKVDAQKGYFDALMKMDQNKSKLQSCLEQQILSRQVILERRMEIITISQQISMKSLNPQPLYQKIQN